MQQLELGRGRGLIADPRRKADQVEEPGRFVRRSVASGDDRGGLLVIRLSFLVDEQTPDTAQESVHAFHSLSVPRFGVLQWSHEHFIETERIGPILHQHVVRVHHIAAGFGHLLPILAQDQALVHQLEEGLGG